MYDVEKKKKKMYDVDIFSCVLVYHIKTLIQNMDIE